MTCSRSNERMAPAGGKVATGRRRPSSLLLAAVLMAGSPALRAADCSVSAQGVAFGAYDPTAPASLDAAGDIDVRCDLSTPFTVALSPGSGGFDPRTMRSGVHLLLYNLYTSPTFSTVWGDGSGGTATVAGSGTHSILTVYGRMPAGQNGYVGSYSDTVVVTLTF